MVILQYCVRSFCRVCEVEEFQSEGSVSHSYGHEDRISDLETKERSVKGVNKPLSTAELESKSLGVYHHVFNFCFKAAF